MEKLESSIESYKIRLEEMCDLKRQLADLEDSNTRYLEKVIELEDEVRKMSSLKVQIEMYKKKVQELHEKVLKDEMRLKKLEYECKASEEGYVQMVAGLKSERDRALGELERLREQHEELVCESETLRSKTKGKMSDLGFESWGSLFR